MPTKLYLLLMVMLSAWPTLAQDSNETARAAAQLGGLIAATALFVLITVVQIVLSQRNRNKNNTPSDDEQDDDA